jgi:hypothetical protein
LRIATFILASWFITTAATQAAEPQIPPFEVVQATVDAYFHADSEYQPGDLIVQGQIAEVVALLEKAGWTVPDGDKLVARGVPDGSFLARVSAKPEGNHFLRKIAGFPGAYSRLDRLSTISGGQKLIRDLMDTKGGDKLIEYLATTKQGHNLGQMMAGVQKGVDLNKPTGRIYTQDELLAELQRLHAKPAASAGN